ncbi:hypothetical protein SS50377_26346 [Spironucleus salmonicida]|uniref:Leucine rich repeats-containing protein n=1 Tax=Spironucleus salmonicida TaxID=348837 RepID=V6LVQ5_9EUKA|nr:hypothetical protein SS50377_26346 [Spironucleus salmonicida]|eukprot:EST47786.1 Hypothetical protein SS50377_12186 [Spironucleus salmonicida]
MVFKNDFIPNYLEKLFLRTCKYININLQYCKVLQIINIDCCEELKIQNGIIPSQLRILQANKIQNLKLCVKNCIKLEEIHLDQSSEIKIDGLPPNLLYFSAQNSNITGVNIANSLLLEKLYLTNCQQYKQEPIYFNPTNTKLTSLNVPGTNILLTSALLPDTLIQADFSNSNIKHLDLTIAESLQVLKCRNSDNLRFSNSFIPTFVFSLQLIHCNVQNLDLRNCSQLKTFILIQKQQIQLVNDYIPYCVKYLNIGDNVISQLNLTQFNSLTDLTITASQISLFKGFLPANMQKLEIHESVININLQQQKWPFIIENISSDIAFTNNFIPFWFEDHYRSNTRYRNIRFKILLDIQAMIQQINTVQFEVESEIAKCNRFIF